MKAMFTILRFFTKHAKVSHLAIAASSKDAKTYLWALVIERIFYLLIFVCIAILAYKLEILKIVALFIK